MTRKVILDCDPGIDDAIAIAMALFDPRLEVLAITATAGTVDAEQATHNASALVSLLDPPRYPRIGAAQPIDDAPVTHDADLHGDDGLGGLNLPASPRQHTRPSEKVISDLLQQHPNEITLVCLGPLTNLANLCRFEPTSLECIDRILISGGAVTAPGNASSVAERNMYFDPPSADLVLRSAITKQMLPLDVTEEVAFGVDVLEKLPDRHGRIGSMLHKLLSFAFRTTRVKLGRELMPLYDPTVLVALTEPELFTWSSVPCRVETKGELTRGMTVVDRRLRAQWQENMEVAMGVDVEGVQDAIERLLQFSAQQS
ncbi:MAG: nucleoside hydrolase [Planctomycetota bacterium]